MRSVPGQRGQLIDCWVTVSNADAAVGFPLTCAPSAPLGNVVPAYEACDLFVSSNRDDPTDHSQ